VSKGFHRVVEPYFYYSVAVGLIVQEKNWWGPEGISAQSICTWDVRLNMGGWLSLCQPGYTEAKVVLEEVSEFKELALESLALRKTV
jgi:hypothetical protein